MRGDRAKLGNGGGSIREGQEWICIVVLLSRHATVSSCDRKIDSEASSTRGVPGRRAPRGSSSVAQRARIGTLSCAGLSGRSTSLRGGDG